MNFPKVEDIQKNLELRNKRPHQKEYDSVRDMISIQMMEMAKAGQVALHTEEFKRLNRYDGKLGDKMIKELQDNGFEVELSDPGHNIRWPGEEIRDRQVETAMRALEKENEGMTTI